MIEPTRPPTNPFAPQETKEASSSKEISGSQQIKDWFQEIKRGHPGKTVELHCSFPKTETGAYLFSTYKTGNSTYLKLDLQWRCLIKENGRKTEISYPTSSDPLLNRDFIYLESAKIDPKLADVEATMEKTFDLFRAYRKELLLKNDPDTYIPQFTSTEEERLQLANLIRKNAFSIQMTASREDQTRTKAWQPAKKTQYSLISDGVQWTSEKHNALYTTAWLGKKTLIDETKPFPLILRRHKRYMARFICDAESGFKGMQAKQLDSLLLVDPQDLLQKLERFPFISQEYYAQHLETESHKYADYLDVLIEQNRMNVAKLSLKKEELNRAPSRERAKELESEIAHLKDQIRSSLLAMEETRLFLQHLKRQAAKIPHEKQRFAQPFSRRAAHYSRQQETVKAMIAGLSFPLKTTVVRSIHSRIRRRDRAIKKLERVLNKNLVSEIHPLTLSNMRWMAQQKFWQTYATQRQQELATRYASKDLPSIADFPKATEKEKLATEKESLVNDLLAWEQKSPDEKKTILATYKTWHENIEKEKKRIRELEEKFEALSTKLPADYTNLHERIDASLNDFKRIEEEKNQPDEMMAWVAKAKRQLQGVARDATGEQQTSRAELDSRKELWKKNPVLVQDYEILQNEMPKSIEDLEKDLPSPE